VGIEETEGAEPIYVAENVVLTKHNRTTLCTRSLIYIYIYIYGGHVLFTRTSNYSYVRTGVLVSLADVSNGNRNVGRTPVSGR